MGEALPCRNVHKQRERFLLLFLLCGNFAKSAAQTELLQNPHLNRGDITYRRREEDPNLARVVLDFLSSAPVFLCIFFFLIRLNFCGKLKSQWFNFPV